MPVLPAVGSRIVCPGAIAPFSSASSISAFATRSLTEPVGLRDSSFAQMRTPGLGDSRGSSISGVLPIDCTRSPYRPPQGLFLSRSAAITSRNIAPADGEPLGCGRRERLRLRLAGHRLRLRWQRLGAATVRERTRRGRARVRAALRGSRAAELDRRPEALLLAAVPRHEGDLPADDVPRCLGCLRL